MRLLFLIPFLAISLTGVYFFRNYSLRLAVTSPTPLPTAQPATSDGVTVTYNNSEFIIYLQKIGDPKKLTLIPNFSEKKSSATIMEEYGCRYGANAGFYTAEGKPLGLFFAGGKLINSKVHNSSLFNGFALGKSDGFLDIRSKTPQSEEGNFNFYFQSGPLFSPETKLSLKNDEFARRVLLSKTSQGEFFLLAITESDNVNSGPLLSDLPEIIHLLNYELRTMNYELREALNLDGGSASAFYSEFGVKITELTPIGSFLCGKK